MTIWISRELLLPNFKRLDILFAWIGHPSEKLWPFEFLESFCCPISSVSIYYALEADTRVKIYDHLNFSRASVVQFRGSRYIISRNRTSVWKVMTLWLSRELLLPNFERLNILCAWIGHLREKLWPFEFLESFRCSISRVSIYYFPESDIRVKNYYHLNFSRASVVQFRRSRYIISQNRTSVWKVMTLWISRELLLPNFESPNILCAWIGHLSEKLWPFELLERFRCSILSVSIYYSPKSEIQVKSYENLNFSTAFVAKFRASRYIMRLNPTSEWKVKTIWISRELPLFNFESLDILFPGIGHPCEKLWPFEILENFRCSISSISIYYFPESDIRVKSYDHLNFSRDFVVQFRVSRYTMRLNWTSESKVMTICTSRELPLFNFEHLDILFPGIGHSC